MDIFKPKTKTTGFTNARKKFYPLADGSQRLVEVCIFSEPVFNPDQLESVKRNRPQTDEIKKPKESASDFAIRRARRRIFDIVSCNPDCNMMITLTLNGEDFPRDDWEIVINKLSIWLDNMARRHGLKYLIVPEYHKDGKSIHFHGFANETALSLSRAINPYTGKPVFQNGRAVYNINNWKYGYTTAVRVSKSEIDQSSAAKYVLKYITKGTEKIGGRYYLHGGELTEPIFEFYNADYGFDISDGEGWKEFPITKKLSCKILKIDS